MIPRHNLSFYASKTAWLAPELLVSMCPSSHLWFLNAKQRILDQNYKSLRVPDLTCRFVHAIQRNYQQNYCIYGSQPLSVVFACKTATFGAELQVSVGPRPHLSFCACKTEWWDSGSIGPSPYLCFLHAKQRLLEQNYKSLWVPDLTYRIVHVQHRA